jgi:predicted AAA+ superfamily ATPase
LRNFLCSPDRQGALFENLFCSQLFVSAAASDLEISVWNFRTSHGAEVDFIVSIGTETFAVECKAAVNVPSFSLNGFEVFKNYFGKPVRKIVAYQGTDLLQRDDVSILRWQTALRDMGL